MKNRTTGTKQNRRSFLSSLGLLGLASLKPVPALAGHTIDPVEERTILKVGPYLQAPQFDSITIRWITNTPCHSWVEYGKNKDHLEKKAQTVHNGLVQANNTVHAVKVTDIQPGESYYYRIHSKQINEFQPYKVTFGDTYTSEIFSFQTPDPDQEKVSFIVLNDIHDRPKSFPHLMQYQGEDKKDFIFLNGDMFDYQVDEDQLVNNLLQPLTDLGATDVPFIFSCGNHETRGKFARQLPRYFNGDAPKFYFSFQCGPVYAIVLDSGEDKEDDTPVYAGLVDFDNYREEQAAWLKKEVKKKAFKDAKYKIVFSHIPLYHSGDWHGTMHCRKVWGPVLNDAKIDLLISGHTHRHGVHPAEEGLHNYPIVIGGGPHEGKRTIIKVVADEHALALRMLNDQGKEVGNLKLMP